MLSEYMKFNLKIIARSAIVLAVLSVGFFKFSDYRGKSVKASSYTDFNQTLSVISKEAASIKTGKEFQKYTESIDSALIKALSKKSNAKENKTLNELFLNNKKKNISFDLESSNKSLKKMSLGYDTAFLILAERKYRQRHRVKELKYAFLDRLPLNGENLLTVLSVEIENLQDYRRLLLDSGVRNDFKERTDSVIQGLIGTLTKNKTAFISSKNRKGSEYWLIKLNQFKTLLLSVGLRTYEKELALREASFTSLASTLTLLSIIGLLSLLTLKNKKERGLLSVKSKTINKLQKTLRVSKTKEDFLSVFKNTEEISIGLVNEKDEIIWSNKGLDKVLNLEPQKKYDWETIRKESVFSTTKRTKIKNSIKLKGRGGEDHILTSHSFSSCRGNYRLLKIINVDLAFVDSLNSKNFKDSENSNVGDKLFNPFELIEDIVETLGNWNSVFKMNIAKTKKLTAYYEMDSELLKREMGTMVASLLYFSKAHNYTPELEFDIETNTKGFMFKLKLQNMHLKLEEIGTAVDLNGRRYISLIDSFSSIEKSLASVDGKILIKNLTSGEGDQRAEIQLIVKESMVKQEETNIRFLGNST